MKVLILSCSTGGGHNACAKYIKEQLTLNNISCNLINYLDVVNKKTADMIEKMYLTSTKKNGNLFKNVYKLGEIYNKSKIKSPVYMLNKLLKDKMYNYIKKNKYDLIICTHLFPSMVLTEIKKEHLVRFINIATDYECIPFWNETNPDYFVIPSILLKDKFIAKGFKEESLLFLGMPISTNFINNTTKVNLKMDKDIILIVSGSMGFGPLKEIIIKLLEEIKDVYFLVICGTNKKLKAELKQINNPNLIVKGYVNNMSSYMKASKIIISKPGGLTTTEVAVLNKPLIHMMPIPGVETYNAKFFSDNKMSLYASNKEEIIENLQKLLTNEKLCQQLINNQQKVINKNSAVDLVNFIKEKYNF